MCSSVSPSSLYLTTLPRFQHHASNVSLLNSSLQFPTTRGNPRSSFSASVTHRNLLASWASSDGSISWESSDGIAADKFNGWTFPENPDPKKKKGLPAFLLVGVGSTVIAILASVSYLSLSKSGLGYRFRNPVNSLQVRVQQAETNEGTERKTVDPELSSDEGEDSVSDSPNEAAPVEMVTDAKFGRIVIPAYVDAIQQEALLTLKKLKIIEDDVKPDELCTRREYARWLVQANSLLERNPKHRILPFVALLGSTIAAFDDVSVEDPDFVCIQGLAEAGIVPSNLSPQKFNFVTSDSNSHSVNFCPARFISREDLINWSAKLNYGIMPGINEEISRRNLGFMDTRELSSDASVILYTDLLSGDKSITRKVFGQGKRFQPNKPCTKAQAAVALTSGRMEEATRSEVLRLEAEFSSRQIIMKEIKHELLARGDIQKYWREKLEEEQRRGLEAEKEYIEAVNDLGKEKEFQERFLVEYMKEKAALECQKQLLSGIGKEVVEMSARIESEREKYIEEQRVVECMKGDLESKYEGVINAKSILEAEVEALRILRSWIEDEARKSQARLKVLEEASRRWKWDDES